MSRDILLASIDADPNQPRKYFEPTALNELAQSMKSEGLIQPILVRPSDNERFIVVQGERRLRAARLLEWETIPANVKELEVDKAYTYSVIENEQRENLSPIETANSIRTMMDRDGLTQSQIARKIGKSRDWIASKLRLLNLPDTTQETIKNGNLTEGHGRQLLKLKEDKETIANLSSQAAAGKWSVSRLQSEVDAAMCHVTHSDDKPSVADSARAVINAYKALGLEDARAVRNWILGNPIGEGSNE